MKINVMSLRKANELIKLSNEYKRNWISIRDFDHLSLYQDIDFNCINICSIIFDDVTIYNEKHKLLHPFFNEVKKHRNLIHFSDEHAKQIIKFSKTVFEKGESLNIHCYAGKSRSQAIGYVLNQYFNLYLMHNINDYKLNILNNNENFMANPDVIKVMNSILYGDNK